MNGSVRLSVTPFWLCSHHRIIMNFSGVITNDRSDVHAKGQGHRSSKIKVTDVITKLSHCRTVTPVWIHIWWWNDAQSLMLIRRYVLLFFKVIRQISRSRRTKSADFDPNWPFLECNSSLNSPMALKWSIKLNKRKHRRGVLLFFKGIHQISRAHGTKTANYDPNCYDILFPDCNSSLNSPMDLR